MPVHITADSATSVGSVRKWNEDSFSATDHLFVVADGMGGHAAGDVASAIAIQVLADGASSIQGATELTELIASANQQILAEMMRNPATEGMGTTVAGVCLVGRAPHQYWLAFNVGDSRVYQLLGDQLKQISTDHSEVQELIDSGKIAAADAASHPAHNIITRSLGTDPGPVVDTWILPATDAEAFLICSDGLTNELSNQQILAVLERRAESADAAQALVAAAEAAGGRDNITVIVVRASKTPMPNEAIEDTLPRPVRLGHE